MVQLGRGTVEGHVCGLRAPVRIHESLRGAGVASGIRSGLPAPGSRGQPIDVLVAVSRPQASTSPVCLPGALQCPLALRATIQVSWHGAWTNTEDDCLVRIRLRLAAPCLPICEHITVAIGEGSTCT